jgi:signal peptidase I
MRITKHIKNTTFYIVLIALIIISGCSTSYRPVRMEGNSMLPTIKDGDRMFIETNIGELKRGDIITFLYPKDTNKRYVKRVIGLPNETVTISEGKIYINDKELEEPYLDQKFNQAKSNLAPKLVPENSYYVVGDNRDNSSDSRYWGTVKTELITGKYYSTYWNPK